MLKSLRHTTHTPQKNRDSKGGIAPIASESTKPRTFNQPETQTPRKSRDCTTITWQKGPTEWTKSQRTKSKPTHKKRPPKLPRKPRKHQNTVFELPKVVINVISKSTTQKKMVPKTQGSTHLPSKYTKLQQNRKTPRTTHHHHHHLKHPGE